MDQNEPERSTAEEQDPRTARQEPEKQALWKQDLNQETKAKKSSKANQDQQETITRKEKTTKKG